jgi:hypothetical protein
MSIESTITKIRRLLTTTRGQVVACALLVVPLCLVFTLGLIASLLVPDERVERGLRVDRGMLDQHLVIAFNGRVTQGAWSECRGVTFGLGDTEGSSLLDEALRAPSINNCLTMQAHFDGDRHAGWDYARYWHGYATVSRPVVAFFSYSSLRAIAFGLSAASVLTVAWLFASRIGLFAAVALLAPMFIVNTAQVFLYWTFAVGWIVACAAAVWMFARIERGATHLPGLVMFITGAAFAYVDFLTTPLVSFMLPALVFLVHPATREGLTPRRQLILGAQLGAFWLAGFVGLWAGKWFVALLFVDGFSLGQIADQIRFRVSGENVAAEPGFGRAIALNVRAVGRVWVGLAALYLAALGMVPRLRAGLVRGLRLLPVLGLLTLGPLVWMEVLSNHSQIHARFTQVNLALAMIPLGLAVAIGLRDERRGRTVSGTRSLGE